ncbi:MAG: ral stress protein [Verrucomicrobiota bacterium]|jgi:RNA polymerase-binding transcription factor DksA
MPKSKPVKTAAVATEVSAPKSLEVTTRASGKKAGVASSAKPTKDSTEAKLSASVASKKKPEKVEPVAVRSIPEKLSQRKVVPKPELIPDHTPAIKGTPGVMTPWLEMQKARILELHDSILDSMNGVAKDTLRSRAEGSEASAFGMHQADAGSDAYDRDFALSLLSQEQDALYEIEQALKRIELGTYGICEMSGKEIMKARLEAMPFARYTVECQAEIERQGKLHKSRMPVTSLFGLTEEESQEGEEEDQVTDSKE